MSEIEFPSAIQNFFYLIYISNPQREKVQVYADGDPHQIVLKWPAFLQLIETSSGSASCLADIRESLATYGTPWLYNRKTNRILKINPSKDPVKDIQNWIQAALQDQITPAASINPAEKYAGAQISSFEVEETKIGASANLKPKKSSGVEITVKR